MAHQRQYSVAVLSKHCLWSVAVAVVGVAAVVGLAVDDVAADLIVADAVDFVVDAAAVDVAAAVRNRVVLMLRDAQSLDVRAPGAVHVEVAASIVFEMLA